MPQINTSACVAYTPKQMYDLVTDVEAYPRYLPLCTQVKIRSQRPGQVTATITLSKGKIKFDFTTANSMVDSQRVDMKLVDGPFKYLQGSWRFTPTERGGSEVSFDLDFEFANALLSIAFGGFFKSLVESMVGAFCDQAALRYGKAIGTDAGSRNGHHA